MYCRFSLPTPCSPVMLPPLPTQISITSLPDRVNPAHQVRVVRVLDQDERVQVAVAGVRTRSRPGSAFASTTALISASVAASLLRGTVPSTR